MKIDHIKNYKRGWFIGNFNPSILKTDKFEIAVMHHDAGEYVQPHFQKTALEYNVVISGRLRCNGHEFVTGDIFVYDILEVADVVVIEETYILCIKTPSLPDDKVLVDDWRDVV